MPTWSPDGDVTYVDGGTIVGQNIPGGGFLVGLAPAWSPGNGSGTGSIR